MSQIAQQLASGHDVERLQAAQELALSGTPDARELLFDALADRDSAVRATAREGLAAAGQGTLADLVLGVLRGNWEAIDGLRDLTGEDRRALVRACERLLRRTGEPRRWVIHALGRLGESRAIPWLLPYLRSRDLLRQRAACIALSPLGAVEAVPELLKLVRSRDARVADYAVLALERLGERRLMKAYRGVPEGDEAAISDAFQLIREGDRRLRPLLLSGLLRPDHPCQTLATGLTLCLLDVVKAVPPTVAILDEIAAAELEEEEDYEGTILQVAGILAACHLPEASAAAVGLLASPLYWQWQPQIAEKLLERLHPAALPAVLDLLREGAKWSEPEPEADHETRLLACQLLARHGKSEAIAPLLEVLANPEVDDEQGAAAAAAIDEICQREPEAVRLLPHLNAN
ncbi:MAG: HEAT repeat domain-containing protein [Armatimonadia bacterium]